MQVTVTKDRQEFTAKFFVKNKMIVFKVGDKIYHTGFGAWMLESGGGPVKSSFVKMLRYSDFKFKSIKNV